MIITIARKCGCYGDTIGEELAKRYGIAFYDKEKISELAKEKGVYDKYPDYYGEIPVDTLSYTISLSEEDNVLYEKPQKALAQLIGDENCVVLGRCGNYAFKDRDDLISVFITGDDDKRVAHIARKHGYSDRKALKIVRETDDRRSAYHKYYSGETWGLASNYHLCVNVSKLGLDGTINMIQDYIERIKNNTGNSNI